MPRAYIARLLMDRSHRSVVVVRGMHVVGGITYRPFHSQVWPHQHEPVLT